MCSISLSLAERCAAAANAQATEVGLTPETQEALQCQMLSLGGASSSDGSLWSSSLSSAPSSQQTGGNSRASSLGGGAVACIVHVMPGSGAHDTAIKSQGSGTASQEPCAEPVDCALHQAWARVDTASAQRDCALSVAVAQAQALAQVMGERDQNNAIAQVAVWLAQQTEENNAGLQQANSELFCQVLGSELQAQAMQQRTLEVEAERNAYAGLALQTSTELQQVQEHNATLAAACEGLALQAQADRLAAEAAQRELRKVQRLVQARQGTLKMLRGELGLLPELVATRAPMGLAKPWCGTATF